jgi:Cu/Ag efflux protein CusF
LLGALVAALFCFGCRKAQPVEKTYTLRGTIVSLDSQTKTATIKHEKIGDWMEAMTMDFPVHDPAEFAKLRAGEKITATVHTHPETFEYWIGNIHVEAP